MKSFFTVLFLFVLMFFFEPVTMYSQTFETCVVGVGINNFGRIRVYAPNLDTRQIDRSSLLVGLSSNYVMDYLNDADTEDSARVVESPQLSDFELYVGFNSLYANSTNDMLCKLNVYGWDGERYLLIRVEVVNRNQSAISPYIGLEILPQLNGSYGFETAKYLLTEGIATAYRENEAYVGYKFLTGTDHTFNPISWFSGYNGSDSDLWNWMTTGQFVPQAAFDDDGSVIFYTSNQTTISPAASEVHYLAIVVAENEASLLTGMQEAIAKYQSLVSVDDKENLLPSAFELKQNYPNPFNPSTIITYQLPLESNVTLKVFDVIGNEVATLIDNESKEAGTYSFTFSSEKFSLTSGVYFYQLKSDFGISTKKMILLR